MAIIDRRSADRPGESVGLDTRIAEFLSTLREIYAVAQTRRAER
jgi:hypothetical protein